KAASAREPDVSKPSTLLTVTDSAYAATLVTQDGAAYLLTPGAAHRLLPDSMPMRWSLPLGSSPVLTSARPNYWHAGAFRGVPSRGGEATLLAWVTREPLRVAGSREHWVWLDRASDGRSSINVLEGSRTRVLHGTSDAIDALATQGEQVYFVERAEDRSWRLGLVALSGSAPYYTLTKRGRTPAML